MNLDSVIFFTNNIEKITEFYKNVGFELEYQQEDKFVSFVFSNGAKLGIKTPTKERENPGHQTVFISTNDIKEIAGKLNAKKIELYEDVSELKGWGKYCSLLDPDGNKVLFIEHS